MKAPSAEFITWAIFTIAFLTLGRYALGLLAERLDDHESRLASLERLKLSTICLVCGFDMGEPPADYNICPSCGTEFGCDDAGVTHAELRAKWIAGGMKWWHAPVAPPPNWNPEKQLKSVPPRTPEQTGADSTSNQP